MNTRKLRFSGLLQAVMIAGVIGLSVSYTSTANAANGCGFGWHRTGWGNCVHNYPGRWAHGFHGYHGRCWYNRWGVQRCY